MNLRHHWRLDPKIDFLNHGSFGAVPAVVLEAQRAFQDDLERDPLRFLAPERELIPKLDRVRGRMAELVGTEPGNLAWVRCATDGVNSVVRSFPFEPGDEVVVTNHGYNACSNAVRYAAGQLGAVVKVAEIPFPTVHEEMVLDAIARVCSERTRLLLVDHVTSPTGLVFPVESIIQEAHKKGIRVLVDGAHAPGMVPLDLQELGADYYTANHHKWLCSPKVSGFLYVSPEWQDEVIPSVISHAANQTHTERSKFLAQFDWCGTFDPCPLLSVPTAIDFLCSLSSEGLQGHMESNHRLALESRQVLADALQIAPPSPDEMIGSLVAVPLPASLEAAAACPEGSLQSRLYHQHRFELPVFPGVSVGETPSGRWILRISLQAYNELDQVKRLADVLKQEMNAAS